MGHTKTVCQCRGSAVPTEDEEAMIEHRGNLVSAITAYIAMPLHDEEAGARDQRVADVAAKFAITIRAELAGTPDSRASAQRYRALMILVSEMWRMGSDFGAQMLARTDSFSVFDHYAQSCAPRPWVETAASESAVEDRLGLLRLTDALTQVLPVASARLHKAAARCDLLLAKHQASILGDLLDEATRVVSAIFRCHAAEPVATPAAAKLAA